MLLDHDASLDRLYTESLPTLEAAYEISRQGDSITKAASSLIRAPDRWTRDAYVNRIKDQFNWIDTQLGILSKQGYSEDSLKNIKQHKLAMERSFSDLNKGIEQGEDMDPLLLKHRYHADLLMIATATLTNNVKKQIDELVTENSAHIKNEVWLLTFFSIGASIFALLVALYLDTHVGRRVVTIHRAMRSVVNGDKGVEIPHGGNDEISDMGGALSTFIERLEEREESLREQVEKAEKANKDKSVFLAAASHDLRQPLQAINLFLFALKNNEGSESSREIIGLVEQSASSLGHILSRLLDLSRLEAGVVNIKKTTFSVNAMFDHLIDEFGPSARAKKLSLIFVPCLLEVNTDLVLLENILRNLIANAIKNTDSGKILVGCRRKGADELEMQVWDTGKGIAKDQQEKIFNEFYQLGVNPGNAQQGLGLGLSIVQKIAVRLNHKVDISSEPERGSMFSITVPVERRSSVRADDQEKTNKQITPENLSIIVIDDEEAVRNSLSVMLSASNNRVVSAPCVDCLDNVTMRQFPEEKPDIIIADYRLADDKTGVEAISGLREFYGTDIPAIVLTGDTAPERLREISLSGHSLLHKPIQGDELLLQIQDVLSSALAVGR